MNIIQFLNDKFGELIYDEEVWHIKKRYVVEFNKCNVELKINLHVYDSMYIEQLLGIEDYGEDFFDEDDKKKNEEYYYDLYRTYQKYLLNSDDFISLIANTMTNDYKESGSNDLSETEILNMCYIKKVTVFNDRIEITCSCKWKEYAGLGIIVYADGDIVSGTEDILD